MKILFVCSGNTCRSPMAEGLARQVFGPEVEVESAGIWARDGDLVSDEAVEALREKGIDITAHRARRITRQILAEADWIIPMTEEHEKQLTQAFPEFKEKIRRIGAWSSRTKNREIRDPFGYPVEVYRKSANDIESLLLEIKEQLLDPNA